MEVAVGDWVRSYGAGIWQVYRIIEELVEFDHISRGEVKRSLIFSHRFVNDSFKRSFSSECCHPSFISPLEGADQSNLNKLINENPELYKKFKAHKPKAVDHICNAPIMAPEQASEAALCEEFDKNIDYNIFQINDLLKEKGIYSSDVPDLSGTSPKKWTAQFVSSDHKMIDNMLIYRFKRILAF